MKKNNITRKMLVLAIITIFLTLAFIPAIDASSKSDYPLPPPMNVNMNLEESIFRRKSVRNFTEDPVTDEELSTILWAAYGLRSDETHTVPGVNNLHGAIIYVLKEDAAYTYDPDNHSLVFYKDGDWRDIVGYQYYAPIQFALAYDTDIHDPCSGGEEIGQIAQNIAFIVNAIDMGTLCTAQIPPATDPMGLPDNQVGLSVMPIGHPDYDPYNFKYRPMWLSLLPRIKKSDMELSTALEQREESNTFNGELSRQEISQILWATCGYSYYIDKSNDPIYSKGRHRTIPSGKGYYPVHFYAVTQKGIFRYQPNLFTCLNVVYQSEVDFFGLPIFTFLKKEIRGDHREEIAQACSNPEIASAPLSIISILDRERTRPPGLPDLSDDIILPTWYHDAGAASQNVLLEATAWGLSSNVFRIEDEDSICSLMSLDNELNIPIYVIAIGK